MASRGGWVESVVYLLLAFCLGPGPARAEPVRQFEVVTPRPFGYAIGDTLRHEILLELDHAYHLEESSLPEPGRVNRWLELRPPEVRVRQGRQGRAYRIVLTYQIFNVAPSLQPVAIPGYALAVAAPDDRRSLEIAPWMFTVAPIAPAGTGPDEFIDLRPDRAPALAPVQAHLRHMVWLSAGLLAALGLLAHARWGIPVLERRNRPFARALHELKSLPRAPFDEGLYRQALRRLHGAFNQTAGSAVFAEDLEEFFARHPRFAALRAPIEALFIDSRKVFFATGELTVDAAALQALVRLCRQCRDAERAAT